MVSTAIMEYIEIDLFCMVIMLLILWRAEHRGEHRMSWRMYQGSVVFMIGVILSDALWALFEGRVLAFSYPAAHLINDMYFISASLCCSLWYLFTLFELEEFQKKSILLRCLMAVPLVILAFILIVNYATGWAFTFLPTGHFVRGPLMYVLYIIPNGYLLASSFYPLFRVFQKKYYLKRSNYLHLSLFPMMALLFAVVQFIIPGTPLPVLGMTLAFLLVFMNRQDLLVSLDPLTELSNRGRLDLHLDRCMTRWNKKTHLYLLLLDLDFFKQINDTYGHIEGDRALQRMARVLVKTASEFWCFVARYGGDEFAIVYETEEEANVEKLCAFIHKTLEESNDVVDAPYRLTTSIGYARYDGSTTYIPDFVDMADDALYEVKKKRGKCRV